MPSLVLLVLPLLAAVAHAADIEVIVGGQGILAFNPSNVTANTGDVLVFKFLEKNHSATQSSFNSPCVPLMEGFNSGFMPVAPGTTASNTTSKFTVQINDTSPVWVYCQQSNHCEKGMVFSANASPSKTFDAFKAAAMGNASAAVSTTSAYSAPPSPVIQTVTAAVTVGNSVYTTTYASWDGAQPNPTPDPQPSTIVIDVGGSSNTFSPPTATARVGDTISMHFHQKNHSTTQSTFNAPCQQLSNGGILGFDSGFMPVSPNATSFPTFNFTINDTNPLWFYCRQSTHCLEGMVGAINPPTNGANTYNAFLQLAMHSNASVTGSSSSTTNAISPTSSVTPSGKSGACRAVVSAGLGIGITGFAMAALL